LVDMKRFLTIHALMFATVALFAQGTIKVEAPNLVASDEQFNVSFVVEGEETPSDFQWEPGENFQLVWGPQRGTSTSISIINGKRTKSAQSSYTYVLMPRKTGSFTLPVATASLKGQKLSSRAVTIEVVSNGNASTASSGAQSGSQSSRAASGEVSTQDIFMRLNLSKSRVVVGEAINVSLKLYQRVNIAGFEDAKFPTFNGFWSQEVQAPSNIEFHRETVGDMIYNAAVLRSYVIIPQQSGDLSIDPAELVCLVNVRNPSASTGSIFDSFFQDDYKTIRKRVSTSPVTIKVTALPAGAPASFGGGVGQFDIKAALSRDTLQAHDAASLKITVSGKGNVSLLEAPKINFPPDFEVYDVKITENTDKSSGRTSGSKTFEYPFIPRSHGDFTLGPVQYSYYDVSAHKYVTVSSSDLKISVSRGADTGSVAGDGQLVQGINRKDVKNLGSDVRYIRSAEPSLAKKGSFFVFSTLFWILLALLLAAGAAAWLIIRKTVKTRADVSLSRKKGASKVARKRLASAGEFLQKDLYTAFYEELHKALLGYVGDKLSMDIADMSKENIASRLSSASVSAQDTQDLCSLLDSCEQARYSPNADHGSMKENYEKAMEVISSIDSSVKGSHTAGASKLLALIVFLLPMTMNAASWQAGVDAYVNEDYQTAVNEWSAFEQEGLEGVDLYYNLGNAYFKLGDYAHAILYYERAQKLDPSDKDVANNLALANEYAQDRIEEIPEIVIEQIGKKIRNVFSSNTWTVLFFVFLALTIVCVLVFRLGATKKNRKIGFYLGIVALVVTLLSIDFAQWQKAEYFGLKNAIVMTPVNSVKSSPSQTSAKDLFVLHEGTKVKVIDTVGEWYNIELSDGRQGWLPVSALEII